jgi:2,5-diamino-6-(ribosylamino)-4(3H)-pyrimidinone 5'-phosphate reductase
MFDILTAVAVNGVIAPAPGGVSTRMVTMLGTPPAVMEWMYGLRRLYDAVAVGPRTVLVDDPTLTSHCLPGTAAVRATFDPAARIPRHARFFDSSVRTLVGVAASTPRSRLDFLAARGIETFSCGERRIDLAAFHAGLAERGLRRVVVEGGGRLNHQLLRRGLVDRIHLVLLPAALDSRAANLFDGPGGPVPLTLESCERLDDYLLLRYRTVSPPPPPPSSDE